MAQANLREKLASVQRITRSPARPVPVATCCDTCNREARGAEAPGHERAASGAAAELDGRPVLVVLAGLVGIVGKLI